MPMPAEQIRDYVRQAFPDATIELVDLAGDNDHYALTVISNAFAGKPKIQQHKMVYAALQQHMGTTLHALQLKTDVPQQ
jgi:stress-induced morphogen